MCSLWIKPNRSPGGDRVQAIHVVELSSRLREAKYRLLFSPKQRIKPGPKGLTADLIHSVVEMKPRNPTGGCPHIPDQINLAFGASMTNVVRRILAQHYRPMRTEGVRTG
jgi:hypothetical protein